MKWYLLFIICAFTFVFSTKSVYAEELTVKNESTTYNSYYFFEEPYNSDYQDSTVKFALFSPPRLGHVNDQIGIVELHKNRWSGNDENFNTYYDFYLKYNEIEKKTGFTFLPIGNREDNKYCRVYTMQEVDGKDINIFYTHTCWRTEDGDWKNYYVKEGNCFLYKGDSNRKYCPGDSNVVVDDEEDDVDLYESSLINACASVNRFYDGASIEKINVDDDSITLRITRSTLKIVGDEVNDSNLKDGEVKIGQPFNYNSNVSSCPDSNEHYVNPVMDTGKMYSPVLGRYTYNVEEYMCENKDVDMEAGCNKSTTIEQTCSRSTVETGSNDQRDDARADYSLSQTGTFTNIINPKTIYQGGGINIGFMYYNVVNWKYIAGTLVKSSYISEDEAKTGLFNSLKKKIKSKTTFEGDLNIVFNSVVGVNNINDVNNNLIKSCEQYTDGDFEEGKVTTVCTVFLPVTKIHLYNGKIDGVSAIEGNGINNKLYINMTYSGKLNFSATVKGLNVLKNGSDWTLRFNSSNDDSSCQIDVYNRFYRESESDSNSNKYLFIYRPIDIKNPFPNRIAGANWYDWYKENSDRLEKSYSNLQYQIILNPNIVYDIKKYNEDKNYLDWDSIDYQGNSSFISEYFNHDVVGDSP